MPYQVAEFPFGAWLPDQADYRNPGCVVARNCFPVAGGYGPFPGASALAATHDEAVQGAAMFFNTAGDAVIVGGSSTKLLIVNGATLTETTGYVAIGENDFWRFARFNDFTFATAPNNAMQYLTDIDTDTAWSAAPGSPPQAKVVGRVGNFLMLGNLTSPALPYSIQWSAENDPTDWPTPGTTDARLKQSGRAALQPEYGEIMGIAGDRYPLLFQQRAVSRIDPVGPPTVFNVTPIEEARGAIAPGSIVTVGYITYFLAHDGFFATDGNQIIPLGSQRVNEWFFSNVSETDRFRTHGAIAWEKQSVVWTFYPAEQATAYARQIIYSWTENRWSTAEITVDYLVDNKVAGVTLEELDALFPGGLETVDPPLDSSFWFARSRVLSAFVPSGTDSVLSRLNGDALQCTIETSEIEPAPGRRVDVNGVYPIVENASRNTQASILTREWKGGPLVASTVSSINLSGLCPARASGKFARARVIIPAAADWNKAQGVQVSFRAGAWR